MDINVNDTNTVTAVRQGHDKISSLLSHFTQADASWESFSKAPRYLEWLKMELITLTHCVDTELQRQRGVEPIEYGT